MEYYNKVFSLMLDDYRKNMTLEKAYELYERYNIATIYKNGKVEFIDE